MGHSAYFKEDAYIAKGDLGIVGKNKNALCFVETVLTEDTQTN